MKKRNFYNIFDKTIVKHYYKNKSSFPLCVKTEKKLEPTKPVISVIFATTYTAPVRWGKVCRICP